MTRSLDYSPKWQLQVVEIGNVVDHNSLIVGSVFSCTQVIGTEADLQGDLDEASACRLVTPDGLVQWITVSRPPFDGFSPPDLIELDSIEVLPPGLEELIDGGVFILPPK